MAVLFLCCAIALTAQASAYEPLEWGTVATEDLQMTFYTLDTTASALVLGDEGYAVESLPENLNLILPNNDASFLNLIREKNQKISIISTLKVAKTLYPPEEYEALRELFASAVQKMQEQIVLKKTQ